MFISNIMKSLGYRNVSFISDYVLLSIYYTKKYLKQSKQRISSHISILKGLHIFHHKFTDLFVAILFAAVKWTLVTPLIIDFDNI